MRICYLQNILGVYPYSLLRASKFWISLFVTPVGFGLHELMFAKALGLHVPWKTRIQNPKRGPPRRQAS